MKGLILSLIMPLWLGGCYYGQAIKGHLSLMSKRQSVEAIIEDESQDAELRARLRTALAARRFASTDLQLPDNNSYTHYADLQGQPPIWIVVAAPALSLEPKTWCYPFAGCVSYRGYFKQSAALKHALELEKSEGLDTAVTPGAAYSTLGWFADPLLSNMLRYPDAELAGLIFHELAHQLVYVKGDTVFNESFATSVERIGVERWLHQSKMTDELARWKNRGEGRSQFNGLLLKTREDLQQIYTSDLAKEMMLERKAQRLDQLAADYQALKLTWDNDARFDGFFEDSPNNADFALLATYESAVPAFLQIYHESNENLDTFFARVKALADAPQEDRDEWLNASAATPSDGL